MTNTAIVAIVFAAVAVLAFAALAWCQRHGPSLAHRGEEADAPDVFDQACALTGALERIPAHPDPALRDREWEMAGTTAARLAVRLTHWSTR